MHDPLHPPTLARRLSSLLLKNDMVNLLANGHGYTSLNALVELALQVVASESYNAGLDTAYRLAQEAEGETLLCGIESSKKPTIWTSSSTTI